jgi:putative phosphoesterase
VSGAAARAVVLADTHLRDGRGRSLPPAAWDELRRADVILHAGDVVEPGLLDELAALAPVHAVLGNNDTALVGTLPETRRVDLAGVPIAVVHDSGPRTGRENRMARRFPWARVVVFGHSHIPWDAPGAGGQHLFNPGSPTQRRAQPVPTIGVLEVDGGELRRTAIVPV